MNPDVVSTEFLRQRIGALEAGDYSNLSGGGGGGIADPMDERLSKLEGQHEGIKQSQNVLVMSMSAIIAIFALVAVFVVYSQQKLDAQLQSTNSRIDGLSDKVTALPDQVNSKLMDISKLLAEQTMATKLVNQQPTVVVIPQTSNSSVPAEAKKP